MDRRGGEVFAGFPHVTVCVTALVGIVLLAGSVSRLDAADDPLDDYKLGVGHYNKERWSLATEAFREFLKKAPTHPKAETAKLSLGLALVNLQDFKSARDVFRDLVKSYPQHKELAQALYRIGEASYLLDDYAAAEKELGEFVRKAPTDALVERALPYLGDSALRLNKPDVASQHFQAALTKFPNGALADEAKFGLARSYEALKKPQDAIPLYQQLAANPKGSRTAEAQLNLGSCHFDLGNFTAAADAYDKLLKQNSTSPFVASAHLNLGFARYQLKQYREAVQQFDLAGKSSRHAPDAAFWTGLSLKKLGDYPAAIAHLKSAAEKYKDSPIAEKIVYQWADSEQLRGKFDEARALFLEVVRRWPQGSLADESLYAAALATLNGGKVADAEPLVARFDREFAGSKRRLRNEVLKGRIQLAKNDAAAAAGHFEKVLAESEIESTKLQARYYLAGALQRQSQHARVLEVSEPLVAEVAKSPNGGDFVSIHVLRGASALSLGKAAAKTKQVEPAKQFLATAASETKKYVALSPRGDLIDQALAVQALAEGHAGNKAASQSALAQLKQSHPASPELDRTAHELAEVAFSNDDFDSSAKLFADLAAGKPESNYRPLGLSGLGWSQYKQKKFADAAATFSRLVTEYPTHELAAEAAFQHGKSLQDAGQTAEAAAAFRSAFDRFGNSEFAQLAGLEAARLLARQSKWQDADALYDQLGKRFPQNKDLDRLLNEWAVMHTQAENFARADEIFRKLIDSTPNSDLVDNARYSLAESDLVAGKLDPARKQFAELAASPKSDPQVQQDALFQLVSIESNQQRWDEARKFSRDLLTRFPESPHRWEAQFRAAEADFQTGQFVPAADALTKLKEARRQPELKSAAWFPGVFVMLTEAHFRMKQYSDVVTIATEFRQWSPESPFLHEVGDTLGRSLIAQAKFVEAREAFSRVVKDPAGRRTPTAAKCQFYIAESYFIQADAERDDAMKSNLFGKALQEYFKVEALYKFPEWQAPAVFQAAACYEKLNQWKEAVKTYDGLIKDYPESEYAAKAKSRLEAARLKASG
jgi:TolA-binding protein